MTPEPTPTPEREAQERQELHETLSGLYPDWQTRDAMIARILTGPVDPSDLNSEAKLCYQCASIVQTITPAVNSSELSGMLARCELYANSGWPLPPKAAEVILDLIQTIRVCNPDGLPTLITCKEHGKTLVHITRAAPEKAGEGDYKGFDAWYIDHQEEIGRNGSLKIAALMGWKARYPAAPSGRPGAEPGLKLELGKSYEAEKGGIVKITHQGRNEPELYCDEDGTHGWRIDGTAAYRGGQAEKRYGLLKREASPEAMRLHAALTKLLAGHEPTEAPQQPKGEVSLEEKFP